MISKQTFHVIGLHLTVYGLEEYQKLPQNYPVAILFALHGRLQKQSSMETYIQSLCGLNSHSEFSRRHLIVISFDSPNHGSRLINKNANWGWEKNPNHALDMWSMVYNTSRTVSDLIDVIEHYLFGPLEYPRVEVWGVTGFSMGGHASFMSAAEDPRVTVAIPIVGTADFLSLMKNRLEESKLPTKTHLPKHFCDMVSVKTKNLDEKLKSKHLLIINGGKDMLVKAEFNQVLVDRLHTIHQGKEGYDWQYHVLPDVAHEWDQKMLDLSSVWVNQWMLQKNLNNQNMNHL
ncbi:Alpha/Beta hydrolase protein [Sporodiniella umbellata]|nr:Alpha/Beta hydrolase protein [Sporodiniella umbellata]